jgi:hypothetical protein
VAGLNNRIHATLGMALTAKPLQPPSLEPTVLEHSHGWVEAECVIGREDLQGPFQPSQTAQGQPGMARIETQAVEIHYFLLNEIDFVIGITRQLNCQC